jgi:protein-tyrosine phosphatase
MDFLFRNKPPSQQSNAMLDNVITIKGLQNLRDIGGYPARHGGLVRRGKIYRAEALVFPGTVTKASIWAAENIEAYKALALKTVVDLRALHEASLLPSAWAHATDATLLQLPLDAGGEGDATEIMNRLRAGTMRSFGVDDLARFYADILRRQARMFGRVFEELAAPDRFPALVHCAAGKDRTGILVALLLESLGTPRELVVADYAMTGVLRPNRVREYADVLSPVGIEPDAVRALFESPADAMNATLEGIDSDYGDVRHFLIKAAGVSPAVLEALQANLIGPEPRDR